MALCYVRKGIAGQYKFLEVITLIKTISLETRFFYKLGSNINRDLLYSNGSSEYCHDGNILL